MQRLTAPRIFNVEAPNLHPEMERCAFLVKQAAPYAAFNRHRSIALLYVLTI